MSLDRCRGFVLSSLAHADQNIPEDYVGRERLGKGAASQRISAVLPWDKVAEAIRWCGEDQFSGGSLLPGNGLAGLRTSHCESHSLSEEIGA